MTADVERRVIDDIVRPVLEGMEREGHPFRGFLYVGLMLTADGPKVVEFNVRFGDPEAQVVMPRCSTKICRGCSGPRRPARCRRGRRGFVTSRTSASCWPRPAIRMRRRRGRSISGLDKASGVPGALVFHAGDQPARPRVRDGRRPGAHGGGRGASYREAIDVAYHAASHIRFDGMQFRTDIGRKALQRL